MSKNDGGPAFPLADSNAEYANTSRQGCNGMTLRDYFAAKALMAFIGNMELARAIARPEMNNSQADAAMAKAAYAQADAMLLERAK